MKKLNKKGFTLAELLIVVAIVGVLVAISIPIFSGKLDKAKIATNQANIRAAKAAAVADYLTDGDKAIDKTAKPIQYYYDVQNGVLVNEDKDGKINIKDAPNNVSPYIGVQIGENEKVTTKPYFVAEKTSLSEAIKDDKYQ